MPNAADAPAAGISPPSGSAQMDGELYLVFSEAKLAAAKLGLFAEFGDESHDEAAGSWPSFAIQDAFSSVSLPVKSAESVNGVRVFSAGPLPPKISKLA